MANETNLRYSTAPKKRRRLPRASKKPVLLARVDMERIIANTRSVYKNMPRYETARADQIAETLFNELTSPFKEHPILLSQICGISDASLWQWRVGRTSFNVDTLSKYSDRFTRNLGLSLSLAEEAANYLSGIPWKGKKTTSQLLRFVADNDLDGKAFLYLARRQERMNITQIARKMSIPKDLLTSIYSPPEYDVNHPGKRGNVSVTLVAKRFGLTLPKEIAQFRLLTTQGISTPRVSQREVTNAFHKRSAEQPRHLFLLHFLTLLRERHGLPSRGSLVDAAWEQTFPEDAKASVSMDAKSFKQRLANNTKPPITGCTTMPEDWANALAKLAFYDTKETKLRIALAHYLKNHGDSR